MDALSDLPERFDVIIPSSKKDFNKLPLAVELLTKNVPTKTVYIVSPVNVYEDVVKQLEDYRIVYLKDQDILPVDPEIFQPRRNWVYTQFIKLQTMQNITDTDWFIAMDADLFIFNPLPFVENGRPGIFLARDSDKRIRGYGVFNYKMLGIYWNSFSLMNDITLYNRSIVLSMIEHVGGHDAFINRASEICSPTCYPAEAQLYYAWLQFVATGRYDVRRVTNLCLGMYEGYEYSPQEIEDAVNKAKKDGGYDTLSLHSWSL